MKVGLDATPLLGPQTGVGRYVAGLAAALAGLPGPEPEEVALVPFSWRGTADLPRVVRKFQEAVARQVALPDGSRIWVRPRCGCACFDKQHLDAYPKLYAALVKAWQADQ